MPDLLTDKHNGIMTITLNRPEARNAFSPELLVSLSDAWHEYRDDTALRVAILTGAGDVAFSAGGDLKLLIPLFTGARQPETATENRLMAEFAHIMAAALLRPFELYKPVIAAINGHALAGGAEILQSTDIRIAANNASFGLTEVQRGLVPGGGSMVRLARQIPYCKAMEILLTGDSLSAEEAHRIGYINEVVSPDRLMPRTYEFAERLAKNAPLAMQACKETVLRTSGMELKDAYVIEHELSQPIVRSKDAREGPRAFAEKRQPNFTGE